MLKLPFIFISDTCWDLKPKEKELEYQIAIGAITEQRANEIRTDAIGKQLKAESEILKGQIKTYDDLKKKREEQCITSWFYITALIKSAFKVSQAEIESQKNAVLGQTQIVKDLTVKFIESQKQDKGHKNYSTCKKRHTK